MFCTNCGAKLNTDTSFCTECGKATSLVENQPKPTPSYQTITQPKSVSERWWHRLGRVIYYGMYLNLLWMIPLTWSENTSYYSSYSKTYSDSYGEAFWYTLLACVIYVGILRVFNIGTVYVVKVEKLNWHKEVISFF